MEELTKINEVLSPAAVGARNGAENEMRAETEPDLPRHISGNVAFNRRAENRHLNPQYLRNHRFLGHQQVDEEGDMEASMHKRHPLLAGSHESLEGLDD